MRNGKKRKRQHNSVDSGWYSTGGPSSPPALASRPASLEPMSQHLYLGADQLSMPSPFQLAAAGPGHTPSKQDRQRNQGCFCRRIRGRHLFPLQRLQPLQTFSFSNNFQVHHIFSSIFVSKLVFQASMYSGTQTCLNQQYLEWGCNSVIKNERVKTVLS